MKTKRSSLAGFTLITTVIALAIGAASFTFLMMQINQARKAATLVTKRLELEDIRNNLRQTLDCTSTKAGVPTPCPVNTRIALKRSSSTVLVAATGAFTAIGSYELQSVCSATAGTYTVMYRLKGATAWMPSLFTVPLTCP